MFTVAILIMAAALHLCKWRPETKERTAHNMGSSSTDAPWLKLQALT